MNFNNIFLGFDETKSIEHLFIREGLISSYCTDFDYDDRAFTDEVYLSKHKRINDKSLLFRLLLLYENFDSNTLSVYNLDKLVDLGLINEKSQIARNGLLLDSSAERILYEREKTKNLYENKIHNSIADMFWNIDNEYLTDINSGMDDEVIAELTNSILQIDYCRFEHLLRQFDIFNIIRNEIDELRDYDEQRVQMYNRMQEQNVSANTIMNGIVRKAKRLVNNAEKALGQQENYLSIINNSFRPNGKNVCMDCKYRHSLSKCYNESFCEYRTMKDVALQDFFTSTEMKSPLYTKSLKLSNMVRDIKPIEDIYYIVNIKLADQLKSLPTPNSVKEVLALRNRPEIKSFREIFSIWCECLENGDEETMKLIHKDFQKAQIVLDEYYSHETSKTRISGAIKQSIINLVLECVGVFVPFISFLFGLPTPFIERKRVLEKRKSEWLFLLTK